MSGQSLDELEDWLEAHQLEFISRMRRIRSEEDRGGQGRDLPELLKRQLIES